MQATKKKTLWQRIRRDHQLLILLIPGLLFYAIFRYGPMYGIVIAFKKYSPFLGVAKSPWVGTMYFQQFFNSSEFFKLFKNTLILGFWSMFFGFPAPILFALILNEVRASAVKKLYQTISYLPYFLSLVVICSIFRELFSVSSGLINRVITAMGGQTIHFLVRPEWYRFIYILSGVWAGLGSGAIVYLAALAGVDQQLYEAARIDGCTRVKMIWYITLPSILPTIVTMFLLNCGKIMRIGPDKALLLYNSMTYEVADIFSTYVYRIGLEKKNFSLATAVGLFESVIAVVILLVANTASRRITGESLW